MRINLNSNLLEKYNVPVPRYTSYPPANMFTKDFIEKDYISLVSGSNRNGSGNIAFYIHIPFCKTICHYCGCNSCPLGSGLQVEPYMEALMKEIEIVSRLLDRKRKVTQLHYGGGTPNSIDIKYIKMINRFLFSEFDFSDDAEIAIECNPAHLDYEYLGGLTENGFNRFSLGIQDFNEEVLKISNRKPSAISVDLLLDFLRKKGAGVNFDFIYGLPGQTTESFSDTIRKAIKIRPDRLVTFSYAHVPWLKKHQVVLEKSGLPSPEEKMNIFLEAYHHLTEGGYNHVGLDHFVLDNDDLYKALKTSQLHRNFQGYCTRRTTGQVYAFGVTGISQLDSGYSQNVKDVNDYISIIKNGRLPVERGYITNDEDRLIREVINEIMCNRRLSFREVAEKNITGEAELKGLLGFNEKTAQELSDDGLISLINGDIEVTGMGSLFIRNIAAVFDIRHKPGSQTYSRTV